MCHPGALDPGRHFVSFQQGCSTLFLSGVAPSWPILEIGMAAHGIPRADASYRAFLRIGTCAVVLCLCLFAARPLSAAENRLVAEFWAEREPFIRTDVEYPLRRDDALRRILAEAQWTFSGLVYGYRFHYRPFDRARGVAEQFDLELHAEIPWGDPALSVVNVRHADKRYFVQLQYRMAEHQAAWSSGWQSRAIPRSAASGEAPLWPGVEQKRVAVEDAIRMAVREHLRGVTRNKPHSARGRLILTAPPRVWIDSGAYKASVQIKVIVDDLRPYEFF